MAANLRMRRGIGIGGAVLRMVRRVPVTVMTVIRGKNEAEPRGMVDCEVIGRVREGTGNAYSEAGRGGPDPAATIAHPGRDSGAGRVVEYAAGR